MTDGPRPHPRNHARLAPLRRRDGEFRRGRQAGALADPPPRADQILVRSDAVGLCYSDVKIIRQGGSHPRLYNRDLAADPVVQGHEVTMTVVAVGEAWRNRFAPGQRLGCRPTSITAG